MPRVVNWMAGKSGTLGGKAQENLEMSEEQVLDLRHADLMIKLGFMKEEDLSG